MTTVLCITARHWPRQYVRVIIIIVIAAAVGHWNPAATLPLIGGVALAAAALGTASPAAEAA